MAGYPAFLSEAALTAEGGETLQRVLQAWCVRYSVPNNGQAKKDTEATIRDWIKSGITDIDRLHALLQPWPCDSWPNKSPELPFLDRSFEQYGV
jgi:hypothetical protein